jgi:hypothetical protein
MSQDRDRIAEAHEALDRRARQRHAKALAMAELTPEAIEAEEERQRKHALEQMEAEGVPVSPIGSYHSDRVAEKMKDPEYAAAHEAAILAEDDGYWTPAPDDKDAQGYRPGENPNTPEQQAAATLSEKLAAALQPAIDETTAPALIDVGVAIFQWALASSEDAENSDGYQLAVQVQVDDQPPGGVILEITQDMLERWRAGVGLQKNRTEHKRFAAGLVEKAIELASLETGNHLIFALEQLMSEPTKTAVGEDERVWTFPEGSDVSVPIQDWPEGMEKPPPFPADDEDDLVPDELAE